MARDSIAKSYDFFVAKEQAGESFSLQQLCAATGWKLATPKTYLTKKWARILTEDPDTGEYTVRGVSDYTPDEYARHMSQVAGVAPESTSQVELAGVHRLLAKAREAALAALETYNRPTAGFRTETFTMLMVVAWTALLHAIFEQRGIDYFHTDDDGNHVLVDGEPKAWELGRCATQYFGDTNPPTRKNLEFMILLRNKVEHRYVPAIDGHVAGECQALLPNFDDLLTRTFGDEYAIRESLAVPLQTSAVRTATQLEAMKAFQSKQYEEVRDFIDAYRDGLSDGIYEDPRFSFRVYMALQGSNIVQKVR